MTCFSCHQNQKPLINGEMKLAQKKKSPFLTLFIRRHTCVTSLNKTDFSLNHLLWSGILKRKLFFFHNLLVFFLWLTNLIFLGSKITEHGGCSHEIKRSLVLGRKAMTNLDSVLKSRNITLPTKVCLVKAMVFPVVMYGKGDQPGVFFGRNDAKAETLILWPPHVKSWLDRKSVV